MKWGIIASVSGCLLATAATAGVRVFVEEANGLAWLKYECTAGEVVRAFALDVTLDRGQVMGISNFFVGPSSAAGRGYGIFPAAFRDHITVSTAGTVANWSVSGYDPLATLADAPGDTLGGLGTSGVTLEFGALWDAASPAAAPAASGTLCALQLSPVVALQGANVTLAANASRGGVVASPDGTVVTPTFAGAHVGPLPQIAVEQPLGTTLGDGGARDFGAVAVGANASLTFTIRNPGTGDLTGLAIAADGSNAAEFAVTSSPVAPVSGPSGTTAFTVTFTPTALASRSAALHIASNASAANPFDLSLTGTGVSPFDAWMAAAGVPPLQAGPDQSPHGDGVTNLQKFAFNLDPTKPDARHLVAGMASTAGLPLVTTGTNGRLHLDFIRRKASGNPGIFYKAEFSSDLVSWIDLTGLATLTPIDSTWERVGVDDVPPPGASRRFARVVVSQIALGTGPQPLLVVELPGGIGLIDGLSTVDFGTTATGMPVALVFSIKNTGTANLTALAVAQDGANSGDFTLGGLGATMLAPGASTTLPVTFTPAATGARSAAIHLSSNDAAASPFDINLTGIGTLGAVQAWRQTYFGSSANSGDGADLNDPDHDGVPNLLEFAFGLHPKQNSAGGLPRPQLIGNSLVFSFRQPAGVSGITYGAQWSQTLLPNSWIDLTDAGTPPQHIFSVPVATHPRLYLRLKVTDPSAP